MERTDKILGILVFVVSGVMIMFMGLNINVIVYRTILSILIIIDLALVICVFTRLVKKYS